MRLLFSATFVFGVNLVIERPEVDDDEYQGDQSKWGKHRGEQGAGHND